MTIETLRARRRALIVLVLVVAALSVLDARAASPRIFYVTPDGAGARDGSAWRSAGTLGDVPRLIDRAAPGDEIWIHGGMGAYRTDGPLNITAGGDHRAPVVVRGVAADGSARATPRLVGTRSDPYDPDGDAGGELFKLLGGADHLRFENLAFVNQGNGAFRIGANIHDLAITDVRADNVRRLIEDYASGSEPSATITGLRVEDVEVRGFSKGVIRLRYDTNDVVIRDVVGDSERQDGDNFAMGIHLDDTVHDVLLERVTMRNSRDSRGDDDYWNGDGFVAERDVRRLTLRNTVATGSTDGGYDLKSSETVLIRARASGNKRNFRFWGQANVFACEGSDPVNRGGTGGRANLWVGEDAQVRLVGCAFADDETGRQLMSIEDGADVTIVGDRRARADDLRVGTGAVVRQHALVDTACSGITSAPFDDTARSYHREAIACMADRGIAEGTGPRTYAPEQRVTRGQMATFLSRLVGEAGGQLSSGTGTAFTDVGDTVHATNIRRLASAGIVDGFADRTYRPQVPVTRSQMASLLDRAYAFSARAALPSAGFDAFADDRGSVHEAAINRLAGAGITLGGDSGAFGTTRRVDRAQMATFLARTLGALALPSG